MLKSLPTDTTTLEPNDAWPAQGEWTYEDYLRLPDDNHRYEIISGVLYMASAPSFHHQYVVSELFGELRNFVKSNLLGIVLTAPLDVRLPNQSGIIQPDILFIRAENIPAENFQAFLGVPDLVVEVLSPSTRRYDTATKLNAYEQAGVREYWLIDPIAHHAVVYALPENGREYINAGEYTAEHTLTSPLLKNFTLPIRNIMPQ